MAYYVNMTDKFMSGWGEARGGASYLCVECETLEQAKAIEMAARKRPEMIRVMIADRPRRRSGSHTSVKPFSKMGGPWLDFVLNIPRP